MFDMNRKKFSWSTFVSIFDGSGRWGHVASAATSDSRIKVNAELRKIARGKELSDEKRRRARQVVAQYREGSEHCKTPNAKVGAALKNYLPSKGSR